MVLFQKLHRDAIMPKKAHKDDAGYDLFSCVTESVRPGDTKLINTGVAMKLPEPFYYHIPYGETIKYVWEAQVRSRSGLALSGLTVLNSPGTIDTGYTGEICVILNLKQGCHTRDIYPGMKIAQLVFNLVVHPRIKIVEKLPTTNRGMGGFGSTGNH